MRIQDDGMSLVGAAVLGNSVMKRRRNNPGGVYRILGLSWIPDGDYVLAGAYQFLVMTQIQNEGYPLAGSKISILSANVFYVLLCRNFCPNKIKSFYFTANL